MNNPIPHNRLTFGEEECAAVLRVVRSGQWSQGECVQELEQALAVGAGVQYAVCVGSGLAALRLGLGALGIMPGDVVLVPAYSCVALANATLAWHASPVPVEVARETWNLDEQAWQDAIERLHPRAMIAVNTFGSPANIQALAQCGIPLLEDCSHGFGIDIDGKRLGARATIGILSFHATKLLGGGEGGAVLTNSADLAEFVRSARDYADQPPSPHRHNDKMSDLEAALVLHQLKRLPELILRREALARRYVELLSPVTDVCGLPALNKKRVWYRFVVEMLENAAEHVVTELEEWGVRAAQPASDWRPEGGPHCPVADQAYKHLVSLPLYPTLSESEQDRVVESFLNVCKEKAFA